MPVGVNDDETPTEEAYPPPRQPLRLRVVIITLALVLVAFFVFGRVVKKHCPTSVAGSFNVTTCEQIHTSTHVWVGV
jgi:hypothetical protein